MNLDQGFNIGRMGSALALALSFLVCFSALRLGSVLTVPNIGPWYSTLQKPFFTPPNLAFPIVWPVLFVLMSVSLWRVVAKSGVPLARNGALLPFAVQLVLNIAWSWAFFASRNPPLGMAVIAALFLAIVWTIAAFRRYDRLAAWLLAPYILWVAYAALLNAAIWRLNL